MRFVVKNDEDKTPRLASRETYDALLTIIRSKNKDLISDAIYRESYDTEDGKRSRVEDKLAISYKSKCAYCERICKADIEHYRPKKKVDEDNTHPGYYWLCYEWTNLIPSCITCNREGAKHNQFPIIGTRVKSPSLLADGNLNLDTCKAGNDLLRDEMPFLLHPEVDNPERFFEFEIDAEGKGIRIIGIDPQGRGKKTIEICFLNRLELRLDRVERVIDDFKDSINSLFIQLENANISNEDFQNMVVHHLQTLKQKSVNEEKTHTLLRKYIVANSNNFQKIALPFLAHKVQNIILEAFKSIELL